MTQHTGNLPVLGAALTLDELAQHHDWVLASQRDIELQDFVTAKTLNGDWSASATRARDLLADHTGRLGIHGPFWGFTIDTRDPDVRAIVAKRLDQGLDVCEAISATHMVIHSPFTTWDHNNLDNGNGALQELTEVVHEVIGPAVRRAADIGVTLVIENIEDKDPHARVALAQSFDSDAVRVSLDTGHAHYAHASTGAPPVDYYVKAAGSMLAHVHVQDADGYADRHWLPGEGTVNWRAVFAALAAYADGARLIIEVKDKTRLPAGARWLEEQGLAR